MLEEYPFIKVELRPEPTPQPQLEGIEPDESKGVAPIPTLTVQTPSDEEGIVDSLPALVPAELSDELLSETSDLSLLAEEKDRIVQLRDRIKTLKERVEEKKRTIKKVRESRNALRKERRANRSELAKTKAKERKECRKKKDCESPREEVRERVEKDKDKTAEIAELKDRIEVLKGEVLEDMRELKSHRSEIRSLRKS